MKQFAIMVDGTRFAVRKLENGAPIGGLIEWEIRRGARSMLPRPIFFLLQKRLRSAARGKFAGLWERLGDAIMEVGDQLGLQTKVGRNWRGRVWMKGDQGFASFLLADEPSDRFWAPLNFRVDRYGFLHPDQTRVPDSEGR